MAESWNLASYLVFQPLVVLIETTRIGSWIQIQNTKVQGTWMEIVFIEIESPPSPHVTLLVSVHFYGLFRHSCKIAKNKLLASSCLSVHPAICPHAAARFLLNGFHEIWYLSIFLKSVKKIQVSLRWLGFES
jgi:hypothetical protein